VQSALIARWFSFDRVITLAVSSAIGMVSFRLSSFIMMFAIPALAEASNLLTCILVINGVVLFSGFCCFMLIILDRIYDKYLHLHDHAAPEVKETRWQKMTNCIRLPMFFWVITVITITFYASVLSYISYSTSFIIDQFGLSPSVAPMVASLIYGVATLLLIPTGVIIDRIGHRLSIMAFGCFLAIIAYILLLSSSAPVIPWLAAILMGTSYSIVPAVIWPTYAIVVDEYHIGCAYGLSSGLLNGGLFLFPFIAGFIHSYFYKNLMMLIIGIIAFATSVILLILDRVKTGGKLEMTCVQTSQKQKKRKGWLEFLHLKSPKPDVDEHHDEKHFSPVEKTQE
jgi:nitrate/nitrite transporter NarK